ncbi:hypothetical protein GCM10011390_14790 [Aureimonas endophytica]|uniref:DUF3833 family protein n=1 Tax=Aureimonas endophytica TaxID=2027858 RepID=A0A916ZHW8_9HYPH|nr:DUF3833 family protein [Aureimonas endophytica]GGD97072.1 hypothetical protein GCM10011390_14790 [Aureimonas endophytica]
MLRRGGGRAFLAAFGILVGSAAQAADFDPLSFFAGRATSEGTVTTALVFTEPFTATFEGRVSKGKLVLDERFRFPEGERLQRWHLRAAGFERYVGTVETAGASGALHAPVPVTGRIEAGRLRLDYRGYAPGGDTLLTFRHRIALRPDGTAENRVRVSTFGLPLATSRVVFRKVPRGTK